MVNKIESDNISDEDLLKDSLLSRNEVLNILYERYEQRIFYKSLSLLKDNSLAKDLTHDIFIKIFTNLDSFKGNSRFSLWVHSITYNTCMRFLSSRKKIRMFDIDDSNYTQPIDTSIEDLSEKLLLDLRLDQIESALELLKEEERYLIHMKYTDGLKIKEISSIIGLGESAIKMKLKRTREKLLEFTNSLD